MLHIETDRPQPSDRHIARRVRTMTTTTIELTDVQTDKVSAVIRAEQSVERAEQSARERWTAVMTDESGGLTDDKVNSALCALYCDKKVASAKRSAEYGEATDKDEFVKDVVRRAKNVWKNRRKDVKAALNGAGNRMATAEQKSDKGAAERLAEHRAAGRRALAAGCDIDEMIAALHEEAAKLAAE